MQTHSVMYLKCRLSTDSRDVCSGIYTSSSFPTSFNWSYAHTVQGILQHCLGNILHWHGPSTNQNPIKYEGHHIQRCVIFPLVHHSWPPNRDMIVAHSLQSLFNLPFRAHIEVHTVRVCTLWGDQTCMPHSTVPCNLGQASGCLTVKTEKCLSCSNVPPCSALATKEGIAATAQLHHAFFRNGVQIFNVLNEAAIFFLCTGASAIALLECICELRRKGKDHHQVLCVLVNCPYLHSYLITSLLSGMEDMYTTLLPVKRRKLKLLLRKEILHLIVYHCTEELSSLIPHGKTKMFRWLAIPPRSTAFTLYRMYNLAQPIQHITWCHMSYHGNVKHVPQPQDSWLYKQHKHTPHGISPHTYLLNWITTLLMGDTMAIPSLWDGTGLPHVRSYVHTGATYVLRSACLWQQLPTTCTPKPCVWWYPTYKYLPQDTSTKVIP